MNSYISKYDLPVKGFKVRCMYDWKYMNLILLHGIKESALT